MGDVVSLSRERKKRARLRKEQSAAERRALFGESRETRAGREKSEALAETRLTSMRRERPAQAERRGEGNEPGSISD
jgi:hypothetical protein